MNSIVAWFAKNSVVANLLLFVIAAAGLITVGGLKKEVFPEMSLDIVSIQVAYRGAAPEEVEQAVCIRIEEAIQGIDGIKKMTATANEGMGSVSVEILPEYDVREVLDDIKARVDAIDTFPEETERPVTQELTSRYQVINISISGDADQLTLKRLGERVRDELTAMPEISQAELLNAPPYEISIEVAEEALRRWGLTFDAVANAVRRSSIDLPGGSVKTETGEILLRTKGQAYTGLEFETIPLVTRADGTKIVLRDVARVVDGFEETDQTAKMDGEPTVMVQVFRVGEQSAIEVADAVYEYIETAQASMPSGISLTSWQDNAIMLRSRVDLLIRNAITGLLMVFVVLALFLRLRLALWVTVGIPISFLGSLAMMPVFDVSINMMSLFSFILVLGIVVDDAIVVGENIATTQERDKEGLNAAIKATQEVVVPVIFGVLTTMAAFAPMLFVSGIMGKIMRVFPLIIIPTLFFSLVESKLVLPAHLSHYKEKKKRDKPNIFSRLWNGFFDFFSNGLEWFIQRVYRPSLEVALEWRYLTMSLALVSVLLTMGLVGGGIVKFVLFPEVESDNTVAFLTMPQEAPAEVTATGVAKIERAAMEVREELIAERGIDEFTHILASVGEHPFRLVQSGPGRGAASFSGSHLGEVNIALAPSETRKITAAEIADRWREKVGQIPGAVELTINSDLIGGGKAIDIQLTGLDLDRVQEAAGLIKAKLAEYPGVVDITDSFRGGKPEIKLAITSKGEALGLTLQDLGRQVRQGFFGEEAQRIQRGRDDIRVMVRYPEADRRSIGDLEDMRIRTPAGDEVPFSTVAVASMGRGFATIARVDRNRSINVQAEVDESVTTGGEVLDSLNAAFLPELLAQYPGISYSFEGSQADMAESMSGLVTGFGVAMFVMYALLAIPLKSYIQPLIVLAAVPFGMVGAIWGHVLLGMPVSFLSMCGMVALAGVVVNDGLVLVNFTNAYAARFGSLEQAVRAAGVARFRPILLTSLTTAAGVTPLILEKSLQAQFMIPMAVALAAGVLFATVVTLVFVPASYLILEDLRNFVGWLYHGQKAEVYVLPEAVVQQQRLAGD
jgi:multidrug efflux pump subunit AcrB